MKITITIETENEAMRTNTDVYMSLRNKKMIYRIAEAVQDGKIDGGTILDLNGNTVGTWEVEN